MLNSGQLKKTIMIHSDGQFKGACDVDIYYQTWLPEGEIKAAVLLVHGLGEHSGRYLNLVNRFVALGYSVYAVDHIGHGKSEGIRKHVDSFSDFSDTLDIYVERLKEWHGDKPLFLLGHSMGGLIAAHYLLKHQSLFTGAILSAPALKISDGIPQIKIVVGKFLARFFPKAGLLPIHPTRISRDLSVVQSYMDDPLIHKGKASARLASELVNAMQRVHEGAATFTLPMLIIQGTEDAIVHPQGSQEFYDGIASKDKTLKMYEGLYHEAFNEPEKEQVFNDVEQWLIART